MLLAERPPAFHWRTLRESGGGESRQEQGTVVRGQREKIQNGPTRDRKFEDEGGVGVQH